MEKLKINFNALTLPYVAATLSMVISIWHDYSLNYLAIFDSFFFYKLPFLLAILAIYILPRTFRKGSDHFFFFTIYLYSIFSSIFISLDYVFALIQVFIFSAFWFGHTYKNFLIHLIVVSIGVIICLLLGNRPIYFKPSFNHVVNYASTCSVFLVILWTLFHVQWKNRFKNFEHVLVQNENSNFLLHEIRHKMFTNKNNFNKIELELIESFRQFDQIFLNEHDDIIFQKINPYKSLVKYFEEYGLLNANIECSLSSGFTFLYPKIYFEIVFTNITRNIVEINPSQIHVKIRTSQFEDYVEIFIENDIPTGNKLKKCSHSTGKGNFIIKKIVEKSGGLVFINETESSYSSLIKLPYFQ